MSRFSRFGRHLRVIAPAFALLMGVTACSGDAADGDATTGSATTVESPTTTTTEAPAILSLSPNLALTIGQCYAPIPPATVAEDSPDDTAEDETTDTTVPRTLPETTTTAPRPLTVAVVDCAGSNRGVVYATFCLGARTDLENELMPAECPGDAGLAYPGDRTIRRAAARVCLEEFAVRFDEPYATSTRTAEEFVPTEGLWGLGDRRVVCLATEPNEPQS